MQALPFVLAGPILRRSARSGICVWIALSRALADDEYLDLEVYLATKLPSAEESKASRRSRLAIGGNYPAVQQGGPLPPRIKKANEATTHLEVARSLHIYLVRAIPFRGEFPTGVDLAYELFVVEPAPKASPDKPRSLLRYPLCEHLNVRGVARQRSGRKIPVAQRGYSDDPDIITGPFDSRGLLTFDATWRPESLIRKEGLPVAGVAYMFPLPTFMLQSPAEDLRIWAGSCMKPHGLGGSATNLMYASRWAPAARPSRLPRAMAKQGERPHALFLMGDQIYADDVSFLLFEGVRELSKLLLGGVDEKLPSPDGRKLSSLTASARHALVGEGNTSTPLALEENVHNQLLGLGEFCAYYLMLLNPALWPDLNQARLKAEEAISGIADWSAKKRAKRLADEGRALIESRPAIRDYASVMANVPTYALCDDHEVTDDWFFDKEWIERVKELPQAVGSRESQVKVSPIAQYLVANAMFAYGVFQGLGNDPDAVSERLKSAGSPPNEENYVGVMTRLLTEDWSFVAPTMPAACFLDTRTQRSGRGNGEYGLATLVVEYPDRVSLPSVRSMPPMMMVGLQSLRTLIDRRGGEAQSILLITPSPLLASDGIERLKRSAFWESSLVLDEELWRSNYSNYFMMVDELRRAGVTHCINLAGDVHFGYRRRARISDSSPKEELFRKVMQIPPEKSAFLTIDQLVCSPLLNKFDKDWLSGPQKLWFLSDYASAKTFSRAERGTS